MKLCRICKELKPEKEFSSRGGKQKHQLRNECNLCKRALMRDWHKATKHLPEHAHKRRWSQKLTWLKTEYGLTWEKFCAIFYRQGGRCAVCECAITINLESRDTCVDHCHETNKVRGLLCRLCNAGIGCLKESPANLLRAYHHLQSYVHEDYPEKPKKGH